MLTEQSPCSEAALKMLVNGTIESDGEQDLQMHLDSCIECRRQLEFLMTQDAAWESAATSLLDDEFDAEASSMGYTVIEENLQHVHEPGESSIASVLERLAPTDHPTMLGRIGGYEVSGVVGAGAMGVVLKAFDQSLDRVVAIKVLSPHLASSGASRKRFSREAKAAAAVLHPNVMAIHSVSNDESLPYLVMPYLRGASLQKRLDDEGALPNDEILRIGSQIAAGLAAAHAQGLVHRDIKPANILLEDGVERVAITDFGLARAVDDASMTRTGVIAGTPQYMSPEQARGESIDQRSDLFSLGSVLYTMSTGRPPFCAETSYGVLRHISDEAPVPIHRINPDVPGWLCNIISRLMSKQAEDRYASAVEVADLLEECLAHVQQPDMVPLPSRCQQPAAREVRFRNRSWLRMATALVSIGLFALLFQQLTGPPDLAGDWSGNEWGDITLVQQEKGLYNGTFADKLHSRAGDLSFEWSRIERRFNGSWRDVLNSSAGRISLRLVDQEIRGAWTASPSATSDAPVPALSDLVWRKAGVSRETSIDDLKNVRIEFTDTPGQMIIRGKKDAVERASELMKQLQRDSSRFDGETSETQTNAGRAGTTLADAVSTFNEESGDHPIGKHQPPLTVDEVVASIQWVLNDDSSQDASRRLRQQLRDMTESNELPEGWSIVADTVLEGVSDTRFQAWRVRLSHRSPGINPTDDIHVIRQQLLRQLDSDGQPLTLPQPDAQQHSTDATPLAAAINAFNANHYTLRGILQTPVTQEEVVAAIRWWKTRRHKAPVSHGEFAALQKIADTLELPPGADLEVVPHFRLRDGRNFYVWSVRIVMPRLARPGSTFAYEIRRQFDAVEDSGKHAAIAWGVAAAGLQAGVRVEPDDAPDSAGQQVTPVFYYRNTSSESIDCSFPRVMARHQYEKIVAVDAYAREILVRRSGRSTGPVEWIRERLAPGAFHEIRGESIVLGDMEDGDASSTMRLLPGMTAVVSFRLPHYGQPDARPLQTGELRTVVEVPPSQ